MKDSRNFNVLSALVLAAVLTACTGERTVRFEPDTRTVLRNPLNGWVMYLRRDWDETFWEREGYDRMLTSTGDTVRVSDYANTAYVRTSWRAFEPEEGKYAWSDPDSRLNRLFRSILDRGMKLSFRIVVDGRDQGQNTPDYVFDAGAAYFTSKVGNREVRSPYPDDPVFQAKYARFIEALAAEYNDIDKVDFIDAYGLGKWGEGHSLRYQDPSQNAAVMEWITSLYERTFTEVPLVINYHRLIGEVTEDGWGPVSPLAEPLLEQAIANGYSLRHDAFGMTGYYQDWEKAFARKWNFRRPIIFEGGWITGAHHRYWTDPCGQYREGHAEDVRRGEMAAAEEAHVNMMDLRSGDETRSWFEDCFDLVEQFVAEGGYRLYPAAVTVPSRAQAGATVRVKSRWQNLGWGYCPVNIPQWDGRYRIGAALLDGGRPVKVWVDREADLASCLREVPLESRLSVDLDGIAPGEYEWAVALVDIRKSDTPGLEVAVDPSRLDGGWVRVAPVRIQ
ncbi:MAG: DUF4832 domain-containing protein [Bacteroidales bacterium]|nr:DUF4832 domain-containing protein [Bacteroidales bacterium]